MMTAILSSLNERRREMAILRSVGAAPLHISALLLIESATLALAGCMAGMIMLYAGLLSARSALERFGLFISIHAPGLYELLLMGGVIVSALLIGIIPAWRAYKNSLADGMAVKS
jgi:putative ABC transport system permease protein